MYFHWKPYVPAAARRQKAAKTAAKLAKRGKTLSPVTASRGAIAKSFWGKSWCQNLERYSDYANRLPRGRTYLRNGSVIDLKIGAGEVCVAQPRRHDWRPDFQAAHVAGSRYTQRHEGQGCGYRIRVAPGVVQPVA